MSAQSLAKAIAGLSDGLWLSLVERFVRDEEAAGSNPASPTTSSHLGIQRSSVQMPSSVLWIRLGETSDF